MREREESERERGERERERDTERERERERARARMFIGLNVAGTHPSRGLTAVSELSSNMEAST